MKDRIIVVWITHFSNQKVRDCLEFEDSLFERTVRRILHRPKREMIDTSQWVTNGINEYEKIKEFELHIVAPHKDIKGIQEFDINGIYYHFFRSEDNYSFFKRIFKKYSLNSDYQINRSIIKRIVDKIKPDIVHIIGAENPYYSLAALDFDTNKCSLIVSLQTLMSADGFKDNYIISEEEYEYRSRCEKKVLRHSEYIGTTVDAFRQSIWNAINPKAIFLNTTLFLGETINRIEIEKTYDIIYFAKDIAKAVDITLKTLSIIKLQRPNVKLCLLGGCNEDYRSKLDEVITLFGLKENVVFVGKLKTHDDVISTIQKARVALLPVKVDGITCTMREAMANGIPIVTTKTWGTPILNTNRRTVFIEEINDYESMATDVLMLLSNNDLYNELRNNGYTTVNEYFSNKAFVKIQNDIYRAVFNYKRHGVQIPKGLSATNPLVKD